MVMYTCSNTCFTKRRNLDGVFLGKPNLPHRSHHTPSSLFYSDPYSTKKGCDPLPYAPK